LSSRLVVSKQRLAKFFGITPRWVNRLADELGMPKDGRDKFDLIACSRWYLGYLSKIIESRDVGAGTASRLRQQNRIAFAKIRVERMRQRRLTFESTLIPLDVARDTAAQIEADLRTALAETLDAIAPQVAASSGIGLKAVLVDASKEALSKFQIVSAQQSTQSDNTFTKE